VHGPAEPRIDLVRLQLQVAAGERLPFRQDDLVQRGHAIEVRLYAEDPANDYLPATGTLHRFTPHQAPGIRWDAGVETGTVISPYYDPMLGKVIAYAPTREEASRRLARALERTVIHGITTNRDLLAAVLRDEAFLAGDTTTAFLEERFPTSDQRIRYRGGDGEITVNYRLERDGSWMVTIDETDEHRVVRDGGGVEIDGRRVPADTSMTTGHTSGRAHVHVASPTVQVTLAEVPRLPRVGIDEAPGATLAPMAGAVVALAVPAGGEVSARDLLVTGEAMKMEHRIAAPYDGTVTEVRVTEGQQVDGGQILVVVRDLGTD
jgi:propionyl-CoA carboxylase alpha chain